MARTEWYFGCARYTVQSNYLKDGYPVDAISVDEDSLEITGEVQPDVEANFKYELGAQAQDKVTTYKGIIYGRTQWLHTGNVYNLQSQELKDGQPAKQRPVDERAIILLSAAVEPVVMKKTGGPSTSVSTRSVG